MSSSTMWERISALELNQVHATITRLHGSSWTGNRLCEAETWYRRFLCLVALYPNTPLVPSADIDIFWHAHILHTRKYLSDCYDVLGYFLHHEPSEESDISGVLQNSWQKTLELFALHFGDTPIEGSDHHREGREYNTMPCNANCRAVALAT
jgi:hypothetical protein